MKPTLAQLVGRLALEILILELRLIEHGSKRALSALGGRK